MRKLFWMAALVMGGCVFYLGRSGAKMGRGYLENDTEPHEGEPPKDFEARRAREVGTGEASILAGNVVSVAGFAIPVIVIGLYERLSAVLRLK